MWISFVLHLDGWNLAELCLIGFVGRLTWHGSQMSQVSNLWLIRLHSILRYKHRIRKDTRVPGCSLFSELRQKGIDVLASVISWLMQDPRNESWWKCCWWILILSSRLDTWSSYIECCKLRGLIWAWKYERAVQDTGNGVTGNVQLIMMGVTLSLEVMCNVRYLFALCLIFRVIYIYIYTYYVQWHCLRKRRKTAFCWQPSMASYGSCSFQIYV